MGGKTGLYFIDYNPPPNITDLARCVTARQDSGVSNHKGEHSAVLVEDEPRAIINPFKETTRQNGRRIKEPNEPMFTLTVTDRHGIVHHGRIRRLMPCECWKLQGFTKEQFDKVIAVGMSDAQLYKQAGNAVTVNVVEAIARNLLEFDKEVAEI
jgi:DNA (cytosine-5)-methyltransferase 1